MNATWLIFLVILISSIPVIPAWFYFRSRKAGGIRLLVCLGSGFVSVFLAMLAQRFFPSFLSFSRNDIGYIFIRIALTEELSRLAILYPVLVFFGQRDSANDFRNPGPESGSAFRGLEAGLVAGLGFAAAESVFYSASDPAIAILRAFSAAPLHGACGARVGSSFDFFHNQPFRAVIVFLSAVLIHGVYDLFILNPAIPSFLSFFIALAALGSSLLAIRHRDNG